MITEVNNQKGFVQVLVILVIALVAIYFLKGFNSPNNETVEIIKEKVDVFPYKPPVIPKDKSYRIVIVGDSIVNTLGLNANILRLNLIKHYSNSEFVTYNFGYPSTSVLSLYERLEKEIINTGFDLIIIESFGYNPLSEYTLTEGLQKQNEVLEKSVRLILNKKPTAALAFMTPIALDPETYALASRDLSDEVRKEWVNERVAYINNHKKFAEDKGIPVIDVYKASLKPDGLVDRKYISTDYIHPSKAGIELMSQVIADYIFNQKIFPE